MFRSDTVKQLQPRVKSAVVALLESAMKNQKNPNDIILFLSNGYFDERVKGIAGLTGHMIGPGERGWEDEHRREFVVDYLNSGNESFIEKVDPKDIDRHLRFSINFELMIYTHYWETDLPLKELRQLANLVDGKHYDWQNIVPEFSKYEFIKEIRDTFVSHNFDFGELIKEAYHSQLRNAFAHGQYAFKGKNTIALKNYKGAPHELESISFDDWENRFLKTVLIFYELLNEKLDLLLKFGANQPCTSVWMPTEKSGVFKQTQLLWNESGRNYYFKHA